MSSAALPPAGTPVEIIMESGGFYHVSLEDLDGERITVTAPLNIKIGDLPSEGDRLTLRWGHTERGKYAVPATLVVISPRAIGTWVVEADGQPTIQQNRRFVRAGGGEPIRMRLIKEADVRARPGVVVDVSEASVRASFPAIHVGVGDEVHVQMSLDGEDIAATGRVLRMVRQPHSDDHVIVVYELPEAAAQRVRRYVLQAQLRARRAAVDD
jgi:hypothetical protein